MSSSHPRGAPTRARLTNELVRRRLPPAPPGRQYIVRDDGRGAVAGFFVVVGASARTYTIQVDVRALGARKTVRRKIGGAEDWDAEDARKEAKAVIGGLQTGAQEATPRRGALDLRAAWASYRERMEGLVADGVRSQRTLAGYKDCIERLLKDWLATPLRDLADDPKGVARRHVEITRGHGAYAANHAMRALRAVYRHARKTRLERGLPSDLPTDAVRWNRETRRQTGMGRDDLPGWYAQVRALPNPVRQEFHLFALLSGSRPDALRRARWEHLDVGRRVLHFPDPKGGAGRAFDLPLSRAMLRCLWRARQAGRMMHGRHAATWIWPADTPTGHIAETKERRSKLAKYNGDLRQTWRTAAQAVGIDDLSSNILLNHKVGGVNAGYITRGALLGHLREQQERVSRYLTDALSTKVK